MGCVDTEEAKKYYADQYDKLVWVDQKKIERQKGYDFLKRTIDIVGSISGLIVSVPVMIWVAYKIRQEEPGSPVIFKQTRVGRDGKLFTMYKFRSMCIDAEKKLEELLHKNEVEGAMFKMKEDPRVTDIGKLIRKTSLDELPQLLNVLKGDMSLVGPRPPLEREVKEYTPHDKQRLLVKPGCSGLWQISGRNEVGFDEMVDFDVEYIQERSLLNDLKIIWKTVKIMIKPNGAY
ncbi:sugar transferase [Enterococcus pseudoavium]|uniref:Sugar transferase n=1 Tax=Enterococcus pseudoavium TaxID=44007 RepID=A0ABU3FK92_9ENTE|nr:sugar transferase [Enterococcus pseudoavium]MDT2771477.1 sugar transferase [Enterococcus pseudoavium]